MQMQLERLPGIHALTKTRCKVKPKWKRNQDEFFETDLFINSQNKICHLYVVVESLIDRYYLNKMRRSFLIWKRKPGYVGEDCSGGSSDEGTAFVYPLHQTIDYFLPATNNPLLSLIFFVFVCPLLIRLDFFPRMICLDFFLILFPFLNLPLYMVIKSEFWDLEAF